MQMAFQSLGQILSRLMIQVRIKSIDVCSSLTTLPTGVSEDEVHAQLDKEEAAARKALGRMPLHKTSAPAFLSMGLELEESQWVSFSFVDFQCAHKLNTQTSVESLCG